MYALYTTHTVHTQSLPKQWENEWVWYEDYEVGGNLLFLATQHIQTAVNFIYGGMPYFGMCHRNGKILDVFYTWR